jgi:hypothetical protein
VLAVSNWWHPWPQQFAAMVHIEGLQAAH